MTENPKPKSDYTPRIDEDGVPRCSLLDCPRFKGPSHCEILGDSLPVPVDLVICEGSIRVWRNATEEAIRAMAGKSEDPITYRPEEIKDFRGDQPTLKVKRLPHAKDLPLPSYATEGSVGLDLVASKESTIMIHPIDYGIPRRDHCHIAEVKTGLCVEMPTGYEGQIRPRSGVAKRGVTVLNSPGTIDSDYRGEIVVLMINHGTGLVMIEPGDRIAQLVIAPVARVDVQEVEELSETARGKGGFGSTGR